VCLFEDAEPESKLSAVEAVKGTECSAKGRWEREPWVKEFKMVRVKMVKSVLKCSMFKNQFKLVKTDQKLAENSRKLVKNCEYLNKNSQKIIENSWNLVKIGS
jgi:hypothetical protein